jgi:hypothetical protein
MPGDNPYPPFKGCNVIRRGRGLRTSGCEPLPPKYKVWNRSLKKHKKMMLYKSREEDEIVCPATLKLPYFGLCPLFAIHFCI